MNQLYYFYCLLYLYLSATTVVFSKDIRLSELKKPISTDIIKYAKIYSTTVDILPSKFEEAKRNNILEAVSQKVSQGISDKTFWVQFSIDWDIKLETNLVLEIDKVQLDEILLYQKINGHYELVGEGGDRNRSFYDRTIINRRYIFPISYTEPHNEYLLKVENIDKSVSIPLHLWNKDSFISTDVNQNIFFLGYFGAAIFISFLSFIVWVVIRKKIFVVYAAYILLVCLYLSCTIGFFFQYLYPYHSHLNDNIRYLIIPLANIIAISFACQLLKTKLHSPKITRAFTIIQYFYLSLTLVWFVYPTFHNTYGKQLLLFYYSIFYIIFGLTTLVALRSYKFYPRNTILFFSSFFLLLLGVLCAVLIEIGYLEKSFFIVPPVMIGFALEIIVLSLAMIFILKEALKDQQQLVIKNIDFIVKEEQLINENKALKDQLTEISNQNLTTRPSTIQLKSKAFIDLENLCHVSSNGRYLEFYISSRLKPEIDRNTLKEILNILPNNFIQIHRSHIVNLKYIRSFNNNEVLLLSGNSLPVSRSFKSQLIDTFEKV